MSEGQTSSGGGVTLTGIIGAALAGYIAWVKGHTIVTICVCAVFGWLYVCASCAGCDGGIPDDVWRPGAEDRLDIPPWPEDGT